MENFKKPALSVARHLIKKVNGKEKSFTSNEKFDGRKNTFNTSMVFLSIPSKQC